MHETTAWYTLVMTVTMVTNNYCTIIIIASKSLNLNSRKRNFQSFVHLSGTKTSNLFNYFTSLNNYKEVNVQQFVDNK